MNFVKTAKLATILSLATLIPNAYAVKNGEVFKDWKGICEKVEGKNFCGISQTIFDKKKNRVVDIVIRNVKGQKSPLAFIKVPLGVNLQPGMVLAVDGKDIAQVPYTVCDPAGCNAILRFEGDLLKKAKAGNKLQIKMLPMNANKPVVFNASLSGITNALNAL